MSQSELKIFVCPECNGKGYIHKNGEKLFIGICTFGLMPFFDSIIRPDKESSIFAEDCNKCNGKGYIKIK